MIVSYHLYIRTTMRSLYSRNAIELLDQTILKIEAELVGPETTLILISKTIRDMLIQGASREQIQEYIQGVADELRNNKTGGSRFNSLFVYFESSDMDILHVPNWDWPRHVDFTERLWYKTAVEADGAIAVTPIYMDLRLNDYVITYVRRIFDNAGKPLGVICLDVPIDGIRNYVATMSLKEGSYGVFGDDSMNIFYHPNPEFIGTNAHEINSGLLLFEQDIRDGSTFVEYETTNYKGEKVIFFSSYLENGWFLLSVTPRDAYYRELNRMEQILFIIGAVLAAALVVVLIYVNRMKKKMYEENRQNTIRLAAMEQERETDELTQLMLDAMPFSCTLWDNNARIVTCNQEAVKLFECSSKQEYLDRFYDLAPEYQPCGRPSREVMFENSRKAIETGYYRVEMVHQTLNGEPFPAEITLVRIPYKDDFILAVYIRDLREYNAMLNEMRQAEHELRLARDAAEAASFAKTAFLANMSHEIRTPMNSIIGFSELALDDDVLSSRTKEYLGKILENADGLLQIINDILDISKVESGKVELEHIPFDLHKVFANCQTAIMPKAMEKGIQLHFYAEPSIGKKLVGDPTRLRQILTNLLSNAVKFTNVGTVKLSSAVRASTGNSITIYFEVKDSGIGMTAEQLARIYEPFAQADTSTTRKYGGTGLGLSITKNFIELMGGMLIVESTPGIGSKFGFNLTFDTIDLAAGGVSKPEIVIDMLEKPAFEGDVLICEDNAMNQLVIRESLARVGLKAVIAENGREGVDMVCRRIERGEKPFDLIFMDIQMPIMDGLEAASIIAKLHTGTPIIAMTANIMSDEKELYRESGMPDYVSKPFTSQELWRCLMKYLNPAKRESAPKSMQFEADMDFEKTLQMLFAKNNQTKFEEIAGALESGDIKLAHRLAHTLKSNAGQLGKSSLQSIAADVERQLKGGENLVTEEQLKVLEAELRIVLDELASLLNESSPKPETTQPPAIEPEKTRELFEKLEPLLKGGNPECLHFVNDLRMVPGSGRLIQQMEDFEFESAFSSFAELRKGWV